MVPFRFSIAVIVSLALVLSTINQVDSAQDDNSEARLEFLNVKNKVTLDKNHDIDNQAPPQRADLQFALDVMNKEGAPTPTEAQGSKDAERSVPATQSLTNLPTNKTLAANETTVKKTGGSSQLQVQASLVFAFLLASSVTMYLSCRGPVSYLW